MLAATDDSCCSAKVSADGRSSGFVKSDEGGEEDDSATDGAPAGILDEESTAAARGEGALSVVAAAPLSPPLAAAAAPLSPATLPAVAVMSGGRRGRDRDSLRARDLSRMSSSTSALASVMRASCNYLCIYAISTTNEHADKK